MEDTDGSLSAGFPFERSMQTSIRFRTIRIVDQRQDLQNVSASECPYLPVLYSGFSLCSSLSVCDGFGAMRTVMGCVDSCTEIISDSHWHVELQIKERTRHHSVTITEFDVEGIVLE